ncbi:hypothetical protein K431DRAFT_309036 [Polychaeton citri CBS 116435]|uniref:Uncharacterized protein n=1 Tax=Polychaeton citri CBS 116435 TaxID=1314669 RepID=A0A9P4QGK4_9PEZI|nr:hypothetical protein K431DRAFT_309036 [Polychaeton citri CBS 116435]
MSFYIVTALFAASCALAAPAVTARDVQGATVSLYTDSTCSNLGGPGRLQIGSGYVGCTSTNNAFGVQVKGSGCTTTYYDVSDCSEGAFIVPDSGCYANVQAFTIDCL